MLERMLINKTEKVMHYTDKQYIRCIISHQNTSLMHDLPSNFTKIFNITKSVFKNRINHFDNFFLYRNRPKMSDCEIIALAITGESLGIDSESYFWGKLKSEYAIVFPNLIDRSNYNRRRKRLYPLVEELNQTIANEMNHGETVFLVDSIPVPVCQIAREKRSKICKENFETAPDKGFSAVNKSYYYGYKLHLLTSVRGVFHSMDITKASIHDIHYLSEVKHTGLNNCTLIADKGYLSATYQLDLFTSCNVELQTPKRCNQKNYSPFTPVFKRARKRIETLFAQLCDQFMLKRNYAKSILGLSVRILSKITAVTLLQLINLKNDKPLNHLKYALAN
jgi:IS5 family transposase